MFSHFAGGLSEVHPGAQVRDKLHCACPPRRQDEQLLESPCTQGERHAALRRIWCAAARLTALCFSCAACAACTLSWIRTRVCSNSGLMRLRTAATAYWGCVAAGGVQAVFTLITLVAAVFLSQSVYLGLAWQVCMTDVSLHLSGYVSCAVCLRELFAPYANIPPVLLAQVVKFGMPVYYGARKSIGSATR